MQKFYLGMDIGTESVGMACTDENYNLLRAKRKDLWAVRLFDEAKDAKDRRAKRTARRRLQRRRQRIQLLQSVFAPFMEDNLFFIRLNNSGFYEEDKDARLRSAFALFADADYTDVDFHRDFPTTFHLRKALMDGTDKKVDLRHYYLALHHIVKYRGHFLLEGEGMSALNDFGALFKAFNETAEDTLPEVDIRLDEAQAEAFKRLALQAKGVNDKKREAIALFGASSPEKKEWIGLLVGTSAAPKKLFGEDYAEQYKEEKSISFQKLTDESFEALQATFEEHFALLLAARNIYNFLALEKILDGNDSISDAMVKIYEKHRSDLSLLKRFVKENYPQEVYRRIFLSVDEKDNYVQYVGHTKTNGVKQKIKKTHDLEAVYKFLKKILTEDAADKQTREWILHEIDESNFLPKILHADNGLFPHQVNGMELDLILEKLCKDYPAFAQKDESGFTPAEKIKKIFLFKIPYFVGPLNTAHSKENGGNGNAWMVRKEGRTEKITPWNYDDVVDEVESNERFIRRMTNKCTYLHGADVLPKFSMYYQAYDTLNQLNALTLNGAPISVGLKQEIFRNVYLTEKKVGAKQIREYLVRTGKCSVEESKTALGGFDSPTDLKASMSTYVNFHKVFGSLVDEQPEIFENIVLWHTLNTDKGNVEKMIEKVYGHIPAIRQNLKWLKGLTGFKDFGRLSKQLLTELVGGVDEATGEVYTVLRQLYHTNDNFNQVWYSERYSFQQAAEDENRGESHEEITYEDVEALYVAPMVRRGIWQALQMADEYVHAVGKVPDKIFIEVTRHDEKKGDEGRKSSRKYQLQELYKTLRKDCAEIDALTEELNGKTDSQLRSERLYLYFLQLGKCAYSGDPITLEALGSDLYDVDHIIPQSMTKDDSLDNKVLVKRKLNLEKSNYYPLSDPNLSPVYRSQLSLWRLLKDKKLMSEEKYRRLTRVEPLHEDDFRTFINRQLVITNQTVKAVAELLKRKYGPLGTKIVYSKAKNVDEFKKQNHLVKCRETNDLHHARDAYLNIVVGNIFDTKFSNARDYFYSDKEGVQRGYDLERIFYWKIDGAWNGASDIKRIKEIVAKTSMQVTRYAYTNHGAFYEEQAHRKDDGAIAAPRKNVAPYTQTEKYGGFKSLTTAYFAIVQSKDKKGNFIKTIEAIPVLVDYQTKNNANAVQEYLLANGLTEPQILVAKLKIKSLVSVNGYRAWIAGITGKQIILHNAQQWFTNGQTDWYIKQLVKLIEKQRSGKLSAQEMQEDAIPLTSNRHGETVYATRENNLALYEALLKQLNKPLYQGLSTVKSFCAKLAEKQPLFEGLSTFEQCKVLLQIVRFMKCNAECADLTLLGDGATCGKLRINENITDVNFAIIHQSPCGLVERIQTI